MWLLGRGANAQWAVREGDWKLLGNPRDTSHQGEFTERDKLFLVNLADDPGETTNEAAFHEDVVTRLRARYEAFRGEIEQ